MINAAVSKLATYALRTGLIDECEYTWAINTILDVLKLDGYTDPGQEWGEIDLAAVLDELLDDAHARGVLAENSVVYRDLFDTELMGRLTPRPAQVVEKFQTLCAKDPVEATNWYYQFSQDTNYIRRDRIAKDMQWKAPTEYGELDITINPKPLPPPAICPPPITPAVCCAWRTRAMPDESTTPPARTTVSFPSPSTALPGSCSTPPMCTTTNTASA